MSKWRRASSRAPSTAWIAELDLELRKQLQQERKRQKIPRFTAPRKRKRRTMEFPVLAEDPANEPPVEPVEKDNQDIFDGE